MKKLTVVIVNYNVKYYVEQCIHSVLRATDGLDVEVSVVDNHSHDGSVDYLRKRFPGISIIESNHNLGFSRANNVAIRQTESEYVLMLNPDTIVSEDSICESVRFLDAHPKAGAVGVKMLNSNGIKAKESRRGIPTPLTAFYKMCGLCARYPRHPKYGKYYMGYMPWDKPSEIEVISGAYFMVRRSVLMEVGMLDEDYFMYGEDIDLSYRLLKGGWKNWYVPEQILHYKGESTAKSSFRYVHVFYKAMLTFFNKHYSHLRFWFTIPVKIAIYLKATWELIKMKTQQAGKSLGIFTPRSRQNPKYIVIGTENNCEACKKLFNRKGITAQLITGDQKTLPEGHHTLSMQHIGNENTYVVYDTSAFDYNTIFTLFTQKASDKVKMATYHPKQQMIITEEEIIG